VIEYSPDSITPSCPVNTLTVEQLPALKAGTNVVLALKTG
jgi:hypothetical protein